MKKGARINYQGKLGIVAEARQVTPGMIDLRMDGEGFVRRARAQDVHLAARSNPRRARRNSEEEDRARFLHLLNRLPLGQSKRAQGLRQSLLDDWEDPALRADTEQKVLNALEAGRAAGGAVVRETDAREKIDPERRKAEFEEFLSRTADIRKPLTAEEAAELASRVASLSEAEQRQWEGLRSDMRRGLLLYLRRQQASKLGEEAARGREQEALAGRGVPTGGGAPEEKEARTGRYTLKEQESAYARAMALRDKTGPEKRVDQDIGAALRGPGASLFTRPDPPRLSKDRSLYCGNPIDGTAYYLVVDNRRGWAPLWVRQIDVERGARDAGVKWPADVTDSWVTPQGGGLITAFRGRFPTAPVRDLENNVAAWAAAGRIQVNGQVVAPRTEGMKIVYPSVPRGATIDVRLPHDDKAPALKHYFDTEMRPRLEAGKARVYAHPRGFRKYIRGRSGKRAAKGLPTELLTPGKKRKPEGAREEPIPGIDYMQWDDGLQKETFYRISRHEAPEADKLKKFYNPYAYRSFIAPSPSSLPPSKVKRYGALSVALHLASDRAISPGVAQGLILSGAVAIGREVTDKPSVVPQAGDKLSVWLKDKSESPYFSWVRSVAAIQPKRKMGEIQPLVPVCLSEEDKDVHARLRVAKNVLGGFRGALGGIRSIFTRLAERPGTLRPETDETTGDVYRALAKVANSYAGTHRWWQRLSDKMISRDPVAERVGQILIQSPLQPGSLNSPFRKVMHEFVTSTDQLGLVGKVGGDKLFVSEIQQAYELPAFLDGIQAKIFGVSSVAAKGRLKPGAGLSALAQLTTDPAEMPWVTALSYLVTPGGTTHPLDGIYDSYLKESLDDLQKQSLKKKREAVGDRGISSLRTAVPSPGMPSRDERDRMYPEERAARDFGWAVQRYSTGKDLRNDPFMVFNPPGWPISQEEQKDINWTISLVTEDVFPALKWGGYSATAAAAMARELLLLARLYYSMQGFRLVGPLNPMSRDGRGLLEEATRFITAAQVELKGGTAAIGETGNYTTYMTYNPALFQLTRLFWPQRGSPPAQGWTGVLGNAALLNNIDLVGRYGAALSLTQQAAMTSQDEGEVSNKLLGLTVQAASGQKVKYLVRQQRDGEGGRPPPDQARFRYFDLLWPIGKNITEAFQVEHGWTQSPLDYLRDMKKRVDQVVPAVHAYESRGLPQPDPFSGEGAGIVRLIAGGKKTLDPKQPMRLATAAQQAARRKLGGAIHAALPRGATGVTEVDNLLAYQKHARIPRTGLYDEATVTSLKASHRAGKRPPETKLPFLYPTEVRLRMDAASGKEVPERLFFPETSTLRVAGEEEKQLREVIAVIDEAVGALDRMIASASATHAPPSFVRVVTPSLDDDGNRLPGLRAANVPFSVVQRKIEAGEVVEIPRPEALGGGTEYAVKTVASEVKASLAAKAAATSSAAPSLPEAKTNRKRKKRKRRGRS